ncbi:hypothetical protein C6A27_02645 [Streptococcus anginosus]|uniref:DUF1049 domain-containing protein n=1 Tax=Streptococcus anginosus TaxID=1328 RepID=A0A2T0G6K6_STRAP|nr:hypothetical protein [Streptococcus anginosus]PRT71679.1 hypothetical protein C6A27_02645 [Streptococcus anginosus]
MTNKGGACCKVSWLTGFSLIFILIIVLVLFEKYVGSDFFAITVLEINGKKLSLRFILYLLSVLIAFLSGCLVSQKGKENRQKRQDMKDKIEELERHLDCIYKKGK